MARSKEVPGQLSPVNHVNAEDQIQVANLGGKRLYLQSLQNL